MYMWRSYLHFDISLQPSWKLQGRYKYDYIYMYMHIGYTYTFTTLTKISLSMNLLKKITRFIASVYCFLC